MQLRGVQINYQVNATEIDTLYPQRRFQRILFNFPHNDESADNQTLPVLLNKFFGSASKVQQIGDRVHMALVKGHEKEAPSSAWYLGYTYDILKASTAHRYKLITKRRFNLFTHDDVEQHRYPDYDHQTTAGHKSAEVTKRLGREFIFEKSAESPEQLLKKLRLAGKIKKSKIFNKKTRQHLEVLTPCNYTTDSDSDSYISDEEAPKSKQNRR